MNRGIEVLQTSALPLGYGAVGGTRELNAPGTYYIVYSKPKVLSIPMPLNSC